MPDLRTCLDQRFQFCSLCIFPGKINVNQKIFWIGFVAVGTEVGEYGQGVGGGVRLTCNPKKRREDPHST